MDKTEFPMTHRRAVFLSGGNEENYGTSVRVASLQAKILTRDLPDMKQVGNPDAMFCSSFYGPNSFP